MQNVIALKMKNLFFLFLLVSIISLTQTEIKFSKNQKAENIVKEANLLYGYNLKFQIVPNTESNHDFLNTKELYSTVQCKAIAKSTKKRCKNKTNKASGYCKVHGG
jgi:hypothetical protein